MNPGAFLEETGPVGWFLGVIPMFPTEHQQDNQVVPASELIICVVPLIRSLPSWEVVGQGSDPLISPP